MKKQSEKVFHHSLKIAKHFELIGGRLVAGDSTKLRAQNSKKNNFNEAKIERHLSYIDAKLDEYNKALAEADEHNKQIIEQEVKKYTERKKGYEDLSRQLAQTGDPNINL